MEFRNSLEAKLGLQLPGTLVFDYPTVGAIARHIASLLPSAGGAAVADAAAEDGFLSSLEGSLAEPLAVFEQAGQGSMGNATVALSAVVTRQPAGIMTGADPARCGS